LGFGRNDNSNIGTFFLRKRDLIPTTDGTFSNPYHVTLFLYHCEFLIVRYSDQTGLLINADSFECKFISGKC